MRQAVAKHSTLSSSAARHRLPQRFRSTSRGGITPDEAAAAQAATLRKLIEADFTWQNERQATAQCTIDVTTAATYLARVAILGEKAAAYCPDPAQRSTVRMCPGGRSTSIVEWF